MTQADGNLLSSIAWNTREISKLIEEVKIRTGVVNCSSWRYPTKSCEEIDVINLMATCVGNRYTFFLELTYDRILYILNLLIVYLEEASDLSEFKKPKNVVRPKSLSSAALLHMLWQRLRDFSDVNCLGGRVKPVHTKNRKKISQEVQTTKWNITMCSCCEMTQQLLTHLIFEIEKVFRDNENESAVSQERLSMKTSLLELTNWSATSRWVEAIIHDFNTMTKKAAKQKSQSPKRDKERQLKQKVQQLERKLYKAETEVLDLARNIVELKEEKNQYEVEKNEELTKSMEQRLYLEDSLKGAHYELRKKDETLRFYKTGINKWKNKYNTLDDLQKRMVEEIQLLNQKINQQQKENDDHENTHKENEKLKKVITSLEKDLAYKNNIVHDYTRKFLEKSPDVSKDITKNAYKGTGNPSVDMEIQMKANELRIKLLNEENTKLVATRQKMLDMKL